MTSVCMCRPCCSCPHRCGHLGPGRHAGRPLQRLLLLPVLFPRASPPRARPMVVPPHVQVSQVLLLQELCLHAVPLLVRVLLWILCTGNAFIIIVWCCRIELMFSAEWPWYFVFIQMVSSCYISQVLLGLLKILANKMYFFKSVSNTNSIKNCDVFL